MLREIEKTIDDDDFNFDFSENLDEQNGDVKCLAPATVLKKQQAANISERDFKKAVLFFRKSLKFCGLEIHVIKRFARIYCLFFSKQAIEELDFYFDPLKMSVQVRKIYEQDPHRDNPIPLEANRHDEGLGDGKDLVQI